MILVILAAATVLVLISASASQAASIIVAASNSSTESKDRADYICDGTNDEVKLLASITQANRFPTKVDTAPAIQAEVKCYGRHSVEWLPGDYYLREPLTIPPRRRCCHSGRGNIFPLHTHGRRCSRRHWDESLPILLWHYRDLFDRRCNPSETHRRDAGAHEFSQLYRSARK